MNRSVVVITGPTAVGKTALGILLCREFGGEVVSADSMQIYRGMDIGTAKPTPSEMSGIPHHMIDIADPCENYSAARYASEAGKCVEDIFSRGRLPVIVGGTGLYIDALINGTEFAAPPASDEMRRRLSEEYDRIGGEAFRIKLSEYDKESAEKLHFNDKKRLVRAFEVYQLTGHTISEHNRLSRDIPARYNACKIALNFSSRQLLYDRINARVDEMFSLGLVSEVKALLSSGAAGSTALQAIGYKELIPAISGEISFEQACETIKLESRRYAKRQLSWLGRDKNINWILWENKPDFEKALSASTEFLKNADII